MTELSDYAGKYECIKMERRDGILQVTLHTKGGALQWGLLPHREKTSRKTKSYYNLSMDANKRLPGRERRTMVDDGVGFNSRGTGGWFADSGDSDFLQKRRGGA